MMLRNKGVVLLAFGLGRALGALYEGPTDEVLKRNYDVIVVGGGAGGGVVASRLSEDPSVRVLLIEAGSSDYAALNISVPARASTLAKTRFDWNYTTAPQAGLNSRELVYPRGFVLGGSTASNQMVFSRGTIDDYARYANISGDDGWTWEELQPFIRKIDKITPPPDNHNTSGQYDPKIHYTGPVSISLPGYSLPTDALVINTTHQLADEFPFNLDYNSGNPLGLSWVQSTIENGHRVTSATSYIAQALVRPNLDVVVNTRVTKVFPVGEEDGKPVIRGVELGQTAEGPTYTINATKELVLSAGSLNTPQILFLSGIGDAEYLSSLGIKSLVDLPAVGQNLHDHPFLGISWYVNSNNTLDDIRRNASLAAQYLAQWELNATGPMSIGPSNQFSWWRIPDADNFFKSYGLPGDPSAGPSSAHYELIPTNSFVSKRVSLPAEGHFFSFIAAVISPHARGNLTLASINPFDAPIINPNILGEPADVAIMREAIKAARKFVTAPAWQGYILKEFGAFADAYTDEELDAFIRDQTDTVDHPVGTVALGTAVNADLTVKGTKGLRVVDASIFPFIPSAHTQAPTYIVGERTAALIYASLKA
ncbi:alcohol oxidase [Fomes fomentarius]|nr:alcohol oxidase [Fomes fomentarius]